MKVKFTAPAVFLLVAALAVGAHARAATLQSTRSVGGISRVNLVCLELHRLGLSGPGCNTVDVLTVGAEDAVATQPRDTLRLTEPQLHRLCPVLCQNQVGSSSCACEFLQIDPVVTKQESAIDLDQMCNGFCAESVNLSGCSCNGNVASQLQARITPRLLALREITVEEPGHVGNVTVPDVEVETTTEPDWASLCETLCQMGDGGALCNCDKLPFV